MTGRPEQNEEIKYLGIYFGGTNIYGNKNLKTRL